MLEVERGVGVILCDHSLEQGIGVMVSSHCVLTNIGQAPQVNEVSRMLKRKLLCSLRVSSKWDQEFRSLGCIVILACSVDPLKEDQRWRLAKVLRNVGRGGSG